MRVQKIVKGGMAKHGYVVKWHQEQGQCWGTGAAPWETKEGQSVAREYLYGVLEPAYVREMAYLGRLQSGEVKKLTFYGLVSKKEKTTTPEQPDWEFRLRQEINEAESTAKEIEFDIRNIKKRIEEWKPGTLIDVR